MWFLVNIGECIYGAASLPPPPPPPPGPPPMAALWGGWLGFGLRV